MNAGSMNTDTPIPVAVIGCGRMGRLHARVYSQMPRVKLLGVYDASAAAAGAVAAAYNTEAFAELPALLKRVKAATIAVPTSAHLEMAKACIEAQVACLIEKPLARDSQEGKQIVELAHKHKVVVQVGHVERFNPVVRAAAKLHLRPRYIEALRISPLAFRSLDVGVVLDMMIHDIDIVLSLVGSEPREVRAVAVAVAGKVEDVCNARVEFANGCVASFTASRLAVKTERKLRLFAADAYLTLDYANKSGVLVRAAGNVEVIRRAADAAQLASATGTAPPAFAELLKTEQLTVDSQEPLRVEQEAFIDAVCGLASVAISAADGLAAVELAEQIVAAARSSSVGMGPIA